MFDKIKEDLYIKEVKSLKTYFSDVLFGKEEMRGFQKDLPEATYKVLVMHSDLKYDGY